MQKKEFGSKICNVFKKVGLYVNIILPNTVRSRVKEETRNPKMKITVTIQPFGTPHM
jgi:hypothetical protein